MKTWLSKRIKTRHGGGRSYSNCGANYSQPNLSSWGTLLWFRSLRRDYVIFKEWRRNQNLRLSSPALVEHVVEHVPGQLLDPVHDQPVRDHHVPDRVLIVVGDAEQVRVVALRNSLWLHSQRVFFTLIVVGDVETSVQVETCHPALPPSTCGWRWKMEDPLIWSEMWPPPTCGRRWKKLCCLAGFLYRALETGF